MGLKVEYRKNKGGPQPRPRQKANIVDEKRYRKRRKMANPDPSWT